MKRTLLIIILSATMLAQCKKHKNEVPPAPDMARGLLANFEMSNTFYDSAKKVTQVTTSASGVTPIFDRMFNLGALYCKLGWMTAKGISWKPYPTSISIWIAPHDTISTKFILVSNGAIIGIVQDGKKLGFVVSHPATTSAMAEAPKNEWVHFVGTFDGKDIRTYINGELKATKHHPGDAEPIIEFSLAGIDNEYWRGAVDDLRFYDRILSDEEIMMLTKYY
jgi:hypothetical protein